MCPKGDLKMGRTIQRVVQFLALACLPVVAHAATNLECMSEPYSAEDQRLLELLGAAVPRSDRGASASESENAERVSVLVVRAGDCADRHGWSPEAMEAAVLYKMFDLFRIHMRTTYPFTAAQKARIDNVLASADQARLMRIVGIADAAMREEDGSADLQREDHIYLTRLMRQMGIPETGNNPELVGTWIAGHFAPQLYSARFAAM